MRRFLSYYASPSVASLGILILRLGFGGLIITHGYEKIMHYAEMKEKFVPFLGMPANVSLGLSIFAEFICGIFVVIGLLTRFACIPLIINMAVALYLAHGGDFMKTGQMATLFLVAFLSILCTGAGKYSLDGALYKH